MKPTQVLIEGGIAYGNPEMEYPTRADFPHVIESPVWNAIKDQEFTDAIEKWHSGRLPFEDQEKFWYHPSIYQMFNTEQLNTQNGLYSVDLDVTVVEQEIMDCQAGAYTDFCTLPKCSCPSEHQKVLRIK